MEKFKNSRKYFTKSEIYFQELYIDILKKERNYSREKLLGIGDWGLGIGPIPNPQSPIPNPHFYFISILN